MTEYSTLRDAQTSTCHVIAKDDYWYLMLTTPDKHRAQRVADALTLKERTLHD